MTSVPALSSPVRYQDLLPTELWRLILVLQDLSTLDLFSLYNTSHRMRSLVAPFLVQAMATKSLRLFFYQEYVRRVGIGFVFESFDLERDRVIFRPQIVQHQYRFRSGLTLQNPQLEEVAIKSSAYTIDPARQRVHCKDGRIFTVRDTAVFAKKSSSRAQKGFAGTTEAETGADATTTTTSAPTETTFDVSRRRTLDEKGYQGNKNFLDKSCPVHIRRHGIRKVDGSRYSFLQDYPWSLHYQVESEPLDSLSSSSSGNDRKNNISNGQARESAGGSRTDSGNISSGDENIINNNFNAQGVSPSSNHSISSSELVSTSSAAVAVLKEKSQRTHSNAGSSSGNNSGNHSGPRYFRALRFECSMNFLDPRRATRNIIGRWLEGKMQHWKRVLGGRRYGILPPASSPGKLIAPALPTVINVETLQVVHLGSDGRVSPELIHIGRSSVRSNTAAQVPVATSSSVVQLGMEEVHAF
ncbi:hypothetical protein BGZ83_002521 [Gryganskiella cystojenkinii]|nr:hypothetical protein BGZ83_002521 [Gryganskiella cystojenkinii]